MSGRVRAMSVEELSRFRGALIEYAEHVREALSLGQSDVQRSISWVSHEQRPKWEAECRRRQELLARARSAVVQRQAMASMDRRTDVDLKKAVDRAQRDLREAEEKAEASRRWSGVLEREGAVFSGRVQSLAALVEGDIPRAVAMIDGMVRSLDAYLKTIAPSGDTGEGAAP